MGAISIHCINATFYLTIAHMLEIDLFWLTMIITRKSIRLARVSDC